MAKYFGCTNEGNLIVARGCAEDNSGIVYVRPDCMYVVRTTYPLYLKYDPVTDTEEEVHEEEFNNATDAVAALYNYIGYERSYGQ
jgi:hypothetical protein